MRKLVIIGGLAASLAGCGTLPFDTMEPAGGDPQPFATSLGVSIPPSQAMAAMPQGAGQVVSVIERRRSNAIQHEITLAGAPPNFGENQILVSAFRYVDAAAEKPLPDAIPDKKPTDADIYEEMQERIPGGALPTSNAVPRNGMGAFGYAYGRRNGGNCLYAWQWIEPATARPFQPFNNKTAAPVSVRVRLCRPGMTEEVLVDLVRQLVVMPRYDDNFRGYRTPMAGGYGGAGRGRMGGDALAAATGGGAGMAMGGYAYGPYANPYAGGYDNSANYPKYQNPMASRSDYAAAPARRKVRRVVRRRVVAPASTYASTPVISTPATPPVAGYSTVPMPQ